MTLHTRNHLPYLPDPDATRVCYQPSMEEALRCRMDTDATRVVRVDPVTGDIHPEGPPQTETDISSDDTLIYPSGGNGIHDITAVPVAPLARRPEESVAAELTIAQPVTGSRGNVPKPHNVAFIPASQHRAVGESTVKWNPGKIRIHKFKQWLSRHRVRASILALAFLGAIIVPFATLQANITLAPRSERTVTSHLTDNSESVQHSMANENTTMFNPDQAATFILNGKYSDARAAYRYLARTDPENQAFSIASDILENREDYQ
jgi:hypothetical protein